MKQLSIFVIWLTLLAGTIQAQPTVNFGVTLGSAKADEVTAVGLDATGNMYMTGVFEDSMEVSNSPKEYVKSAGWKDIYLAKYNPTGEKVWAFSFGNERWDRGWAMTVSAEGDAYIGGVFGKDVDFDPGPGSTVLSSNAAGFWPDGYLAKYDTDGELQWAKHLLTARNRNASQSATLLAINDMKIDMNGDLIIGGAFWDTVWFSPTAMLVSQTSLRDMFIAKYDSDGNLKWAQHFPASADQEIESLDTDAQGNIAVTGFVMGTADLNPGAGTTSYSSEGGQDIFVAKFDANGDFLWGHGFGSTLDDELGEGVGMDDQGNVYVTGRFRDTVDFDPGAGSRVLSGGTLPIVFVLKFDPQGALDWAFQLEGASSSTGKSIYVFDNGDFYLGGEYGSVTGFDLDPGPDSTMLTSLSGGTDLFAARYAPNGDFQYGWDLRGLDAEDLYDLEAQGNNVVLGGSFERTLLVDRQAGDMRFAKGMRDMFAVRYGDATSAIGELVLAQNLQVAPNPASDQVQVYADWKTPLSGTVTVCDMMGKTVDTHTFFNQTSIKYTLPVSGYATGLYMVELSLPMGKQIVKLVLE